MTRVTVHEYAATLRPRYRAARRRDKGKILDEFCQTTGLHRKAAIRLLGEESRPKAVGRGRPRKYGPEVEAPLLRVWEMGDRMCGKLLVAVMPDLLAALERHGELKVSAGVRGQLLSMSSSTCDRLLRKQHRRLSVLPPAHKAPAATSLKSEIPLKTWSEWADVKPGSLQADLVVHSGESAAGFFLTTLTTIDIASGWTELQPVWGKGMTRVGSAVHYVRERLPFPLAALHTDNGSEFINEVLVPWCRREKIAFTRGRPYKKNDQAYVEQRNWQSVRRHVGYQRYSTKAAYAVLERLYPLLCLQMNFLRPVRKLVAKERLGAKVRKQYDEPRTPYQRLLASGALTKAVQASLEKQLAALNPADLQRRINQLLHQLWDLADRWEGGNLVSAG
ncbi:MAG TPA: transposase family protein [Chloroflexota bacterium]|nr:transposase family protein [Chloroflexota bacterium]